MSAASCREIFDSGNVGMIGVSAVLNFLTKLPKLILIPAILAARPSLPFGPWQEEQLCIMYHLFPFAGSPAGSLQPPRQIRDKKRIPLMNILERGCGNI
jgi:hypothetical protein